MQTVTERPATQARPAGTLDGMEIQRYVPQTILPLKVQAQQRWDDRKGSGGVAALVTGLAVKITGGLTWLRELLAGPPMSQRDRLRYSATEAQVQKYKAVSNLWGHQPTRGIF